MLDQKSCKAVVVALASLALLSASGCAKGQAASTPKVVTAEFMVKNMTCTACDQAIVSALSKITGVSTVEADFNRGYAFAEYDPKFVATDAMVAAINGLGFESRVRKPDDVDIPPTKPGVPEAEEGE